MKDHLERIQSPWRRWLITVVIRALAAVSIFHRPRRERPQLLVVFKNKIVQLEPRDYVSFSILGLSVIIFHRRLLTRSPSHLTPQHLEQNLHAIAAWLRMWREASTENLPASSRELWGQCLDASDETLQKMKTIHRQMEGR